MEAVLNQILILLAPLKKIVAVMELALHKIHAHVIRDGPGPIVLLLIIVIGATVTEHITVIALIAFGRMRSV